MGEVREASAEVRGGVRAITCTAAKPRSSAARAYGSAASAMRRRHSSESWRTPRIASKPRTAVAVREKSNFFAGWPTRVSPESANATTDGVRRWPWSFSTTRGAPPSTTAAHAPPHSDAPWPSATPIASVVKYEAVDPRAGAAREAAASASADDEAEAEADDALGDAASRIASRNFGLEVAWSSSFAEYATSATPTPATNGPTICAGGDARKVRTGGAAPRRRERSCARARSIVLRRGDLLDRPHDEASAATRLQAAARPRARVPRRNSRRRASKMGDL